MTLTKDFKKIKEMFPKAKFSRNSSGPGVLINLVPGKDFYIFYMNKKYGSFSSLKEMISFYKEIIV